MQTGTAVVSGNCSGQWSETAHLLPQSIGRTGHASVAIRGMGKFVAILGCTHADLPGVRAGFGAKRVRRGMGGGRRYCVPPLSGAQGRYKGEERVERREERVPRYWLSEIGSGLGGSGFAKPVRLGTCYQWRHPVDKAYGGRGGVAGAEPPHKGGPNRPDRTTAVVSGQWSVVRDRAYSDAELISGWFGLRSDQRHGEVRTRIGMQACKPTRGDSARLLAFRYNGGSPP